MSGVSVQQVQEQVDEVVARHPVRESSLIQVLQDVQRRLGWLPGPALEQVAARLQLPLARVYAVATFYKAFSLVPRGRHAVKICTGTACHVRGAAQLQDEAERLLGVPAGQTTPDLNCTLETVNCVGACGMAPVVLVDEKYHRAVKIEQLRELLRTLGVAVPEAAAAEDELDDEAAPGPGPEAGSASRVEVAR